MKPLPRNPLKYEPVELLSRYARDHGQTLAHAGIVESFVADVRASVEHALLDAKHLHGRRTEALFELVVASLASIPLLKQEDTGDVFSSTNSPLNVPDYRVVLPDGTQCLVEVKNHHQPAPTGPFRLKSTYVDGLRRYAEIMHCRLLIAVYWARWSIWTLVDAERFSREGKRCVLKMSDALADSEMWILGDRLVATPAPIRIVVSHECEKVNHDGSQLLRISDVRAYSQQRPLSGAAAQLATYFVFHGAWEESVRADADEAGRLTSTTFSYQPPDEDFDPSAPGCATVGYLSQLLSREYTARTLREGQVVATRVPLNGRRLIDLLPEDVHKSALPLAIATVHPRSRSA